MPLLSLFCFVEGGTAMFLWSACLCQMTDDKCKRNLAPKTILVTQNGTFTCDKDNVSYYLYVHANTKFIKHLLLNLIKLPTDSCLQLL